MLSGVYMHHIQQSILIRLTQSSPLRFTELQPPHLPNNTFSYHLKKLLETGYVEAVAGGYAATRKALKIIQGIDNRLPYSDAPPLVLSTVYVTNLKGEVLLLEHQRQPFKNWLSIPSGIIHGGESLRQAAVRELFEKTSMNVTEEELTSKGVLDFRYLQLESNDLFVHAIGFIYTYKYTGNPALFDGKETKYGTLSWSDLKQPNILPEVHSITELVKQRTLQIESINFDEPLTIM